MEYFLEKLTVQLESQIVPSTTNVFLKNGMMWPFVGGALIKWVMGRSAVAAYCSIWPLGIPTHTLGAVGFELHEHDVRHDLQVVRVSILQILLPPLIDDGTK